MKTQDRIEAVVIWLMEEEEEVEGKLRKLLLCLLGRMQMEERIIRFIGFSL